MTMLAIGGYPQALASDAVDRFVTSASASEKGAGSSIVGRFFKRRKEDAATRSALERWKAEEPGTTVIDPLNIASIAFFLEHTSKLEGFEDSNEAIDRSRWRNLPYWTDSIWLPLEIPNVVPEVVNLEGMPTLLGTTNGLLSDLAEVKALSTADLGTRPPFFDMMVNDPKAFGEVEDFSLDEKTTLQWVWLAFFTAAEMATQRNSPLWSVE